MLTGRWLFAPEEGEDWMLEDDHLAKMLELTGERFSPAMLARAQFASRYLDAQGAPDLHTRLHACGAHDASSRRQLAAARAHLRAEHRGGARGVQDAGRGGDSGCGGVHPGMPAARLVRARDGQGSAVASVASNSPSPFALGTPMIQLVENDMRPPPADAPCLRGPPSGRTLTNLTVLRLVSSRLPLVRYSASASTVHDAS
jgi:hypothetical protein